MFNSFVQIRFEMYIVHSTETIAVIVHAIIVLNIGFIIIRPMVVYSDISTESI